MDSLIKIINNMSDNDHAITMMCDLIKDSGTCNGVECGGCVFNTKGSFNRAKNIINNKWSK